MEEFSNNWSAPTEVLGKTLWQKQIFKEFMEKFLFIWKRHRKRKLWEFHITIVDELERLEFTISALETFITSCSNNLLCHKVCNRFTKHFHWNNSRTTIKKSFRISLEVIRDFPRTYFQNSIKSNLFGYSARRPT